MSRIALAAAFAATVGLLGVSAAGAGGQQAQIVVFGFQAGSSSMSPGVDIPKSVDTQSRTGKKDWHIELTVSYIDTNNVVQTLDSGSLDIATDTTFIQSVDGNTDLIQTTVSFGTTPLPGPNATFTGTATLIKP